MLKAILHGKAGRIENNLSSQSWRELFRQREDLLTSAFFCRLQYLDEERQRRLLCELIGQELARSKFQTVEYWPRYEYDDRAVEPDLILGFKDFNVIVEVKSPHAMHSVEQWKREAEAVARSVELEEDWYLLPLGGSMSTTEILETKQLAITNGDTTVCVLPLVTWHQILKKVDCMRGADASQNPILDDLVEIFRLYGLVTFSLTWDDLAELPMPERIF